MRARPWSFARRLTSRSTGVEIATIPDASIAGNLGKAWSVARLLQRRGVDLAIVENHLPAATVIALASGIPVILHSHAYEKAPSGALDRAVRGQRAAAALRLRLRQRGLRQSVSREFPWRARAHAMPSPTGWIWPIGRARDSQRQDDPLRRPRAQGQGPHRGDGGDRARAAVEARMESPIHSVRRRRRRSGA